MKQIQGPTQKEIDKKRDELIEAAKRLAADAKTRDEAEELKRRLQSDGLSRIRPFNI